MPICIVLFNSKMKMLGWKFHAYTAQECWHCVSTAFSTLSLICFWTVLTWFFLWLLIWPLQLLSLFFAVWNTRITTSLNWKSGEYFRHNSSRFPCGECLFVCSIQCFVTRCVTVRFRLKRTVYVSFILYFICGCM